MKTGNSPVEQSHPQASLQISQLVEPRSTVGGLPDAVATTSGRPRLIVRQSTVSNPSSPISISRPTFFLGKRRATCEGTQETRKNVTLLKTLSNTVAMLKLKKTHDYTSVASSRFPDEKIAKGTLVKAPHGTELAANLIQIDHRDVAIASQYPTTAEVGDYIAMLAAIQPTMLVVIISEGERVLTRSGLPPYFSQDGHYFSQNDLDEKQELSVEISKNNSCLDLDNGITLMSSQMRITITGHDASEIVGFPVCHIDGWGDNVSLSPPQLEKLVKHLQKIEPETSSSEKRVPVIHCKAGRGRTGQLIAARQLYRDTSKTLQSVLTDMRLSGNQNMVGENQLEGLIEFSNRLNIKILERHSPTTPV